MDVPLSSASILLFFILVQRSLQQCYARSGGISPHDIPCTEFATDSDPAVPCCEAGRKCTSNRMCVSTDVDTDLKRGTCTDESWNSPHCPQYCLKYNQNTTILNCTATNGQTTDNYNDYCCAADSPQCCDYMWLIFQDVSAMSSSASSPFSSSSISSSSHTHSTGSSATTSTAASAQSASGSSSASSSLSSSSLSSSSSPSTSSSSTIRSATGQSGINTDLLTASIPSIVVAAPTTTQSDSSGLARDWTGVGIGAGIGAAVPLLILLVVGALLWRRHRRRALQKLLSSEDGAFSRITKDPSIRMTRPAYLKAHEADGVPRYELETIRGAEMPVRSPRELPVRSPRELPGSERERYRHQAYRSGSLNNPAELG